MGGWLVLDPTHPPGAPAMQSTQTLDGPIPHHLDSLAQQNQNQAVPATTTSIFRLGL